MTARVESEEGGTATTPAPFLTGGRIAQALCKGGRSRKDTISRYNRVILELSRFVKLLDCKECRLKVGTESIGPLSILTEGDDLPRLATRHLKCSCVTFEIHRVFLVLQQVRQRDQL